MEHSPSETEAAIEQAHAEGLQLNHETFYNRLAAETDERAREDLTSASAIAEAVAVNGGRALVVGGYARDEAWRRLGHNISPKDIDIEVYGLGFEQIQALLDEIAPGHSNVVGEAFSVVKFGRLDVSLPRRDSKVGPGHKGFEVTGDPAMSLKEAARRRDFTINALALDPLTGEMIDEHGGLADLKQGVLRATDPELFGDDPLRALRAMQFAGRFGFTVEPETVQLCRQMDLTELPRERIGEEWQKLLLKSPRPSIGLQAARELGIIEQLHPELAALADTPQDPEWHPEGDVWQHTKMVADAAADIVRREGLEGEQALVVMLGSLCHDLGKPATTELHPTKQRLTSHGHEPAGIEPTVKFLKAINAPTDIAAKVVQLVRYHLYPTVNQNPSDSAVRRLAVRLQPATIQELVRVAEADHRGRDLPWDGFAQGQDLLERAARVEVVDSAARPVVMGRHLIEWGLQPGKHFGEILTQLYEAQLDGVIASQEEGLAYYRQHIAGPQQ